MRIRKRWQHGNRSTAKLLDGFGNSAFIETRLFDGSTGEKAAIAARDEINFRRAHHVFQQFPRRHGEADHLALDRARGNGNGSDLTGPRSRAIDNRRSWIGSLVGVDPGDTACDDVHRKSVFPEEISTPRWLAAFKAASVKARGQTLRSFSSNPVRPSDSERGLEFL